MKKKNNPKLKGKGVSKGEKPLSTAFRLSSKIYFLTYKGISDSDEKITKQTLVNYLLYQNLNDRKLKPQKYLICQQMYDSSQPHFHVILIYSRRKDITIQSYYDFLGIHPNIQNMRNMKAALQYMYKEDPNPVTNMDIVQEKRKARAKDSSSLYQLLQQQMKKDPFNFDVMQYCDQHNLFKQIYKANYSKAISLIRFAQQARCHSILTNLPGIKLITRPLIQSVLTDSELFEYDSWNGYQKIIDHINQIVNYPNKSSTSRLPPKTPHLYLVGDSDIGKSSLVNWTFSEEFGNPGLQHYFSTYHLNVSERYFPPYTTYMSSIVYWDEFVINSSIFPKKRYNELLTYLSGAPTQIPIKGRLPVRRMDNPKHILSSNLTLDQQVKSVFKSEQSQAKALMNLRSRLDQIIIPKGRSIHFLRKLFSKKE